MNGADQPHDPNVFEKHIDPMGGASTRRAEALQALRGSRWLEEVRLRFDLAIEILDADLEFIFAPLPELHVSAGLRSALRNVGEAALREAVTGVIRSARAKVLTAADYHIRLFPLHSRSPSPPMPLGVLAVGVAQVPRSPHGMEESAEEADRRLNSAGQWLVAAIEADLAATLKRVSEALDLERAAGSFDVVDALTELQSDRSIIARLMDALALWYDADVYAYRQDLSGAFLLYASLPGADAERVAPQLLGHRLWGRGEVFSPESPREIEEFGWSAAMGHTLFVPIVVDRSTEWLLAISDVRDDPATRQKLGIFRRVVGTLLTNLQYQAVDRLTRKLSAILLRGNAPFYATARMAFEAVAVETGATSVQFATFEVKNERPAPSLALQWGGAAGDVAPFVDAETTTLSAGAIAVGVGAGPGVIAVLSLKCKTGEFTPVAQRLARSAASTIGAWLSGSIRGSEEVRVPQQAEYGVDLMGRLQQQVDRFGHVRVGGALAVVLPKEQVPTGQTIDDAVELIEQHVRPSDVIGAVGDSGAGVLLSDANRDVAAAVTGRLLRAAREKLLGVRVGVAMFAASTESPRAVLDRALMNARRGSV